MPTLYDPEIHGEMTDEERHAYNRRLMAEIPEEDPDDMFDGFMYRILLKAGYVEEAREYQAGYQKDFVYKRICYEKWSQRLHTQEEIDYLIANHAKALREANEILAETGISTEDLL